MEERSNTSKGRGNPGGSQSSGHQENQDTQREMDEKKKKKNPRKDRN